MSADKRKYRVPFPEVSHKCDLSRWDFETTEQLPTLGGLVGQERAAQALYFGLQVEHQGYNIFLTGRGGTGKSTYARELIGKVAKDRPRPMDWCYVHNFERPDQPLALCLPPGRGGEFVRDIDELIEELQVELPKAFEGEDYEKRRTERVSRFQEQSQELIEELEAQVEALGFSLRRTGSGFMTVPVRDGKALEQEEFNMLPVEERRKLEEAHKEVQAKLGELLRKLRSLEKQAREELRNLEQEVALAVLEPPVAELQEKYGAFPRVASYLAQMRQNIIENLDDFKDEEEEQALPWLRRSARLRAFTKYKVNLFVDNSLTEGGPVVFETNPTFQNLFGKIEYRHELGAVSTDFTLLRPGAVHRANGGYLILQAADLLRNYLAWEGLKRVLNTGEIKVEDYANQLGLFPSTTLSPEPIPVELKVILIGSPALYHLLYSLDEDFRDHFKIKADFDTEMDRNEDNMGAYLQFIGTYCRREKLPHLEKDAAARVVDYGSRLAGDRRKLSTRFSEIGKLLLESAAWASVEGSPAVKEQHVLRALREQTYRSNRWEEKIQERIGRGDLLVDVHGSKVGQVNGISIIDLGDYQFGRPSRISARTFIGQEGVINIEREVKMGGPVHSKGVLILSGYLAGKYAQDKPLALSASLCFEQLYEGIEGDSASSAELYAILSSLADLPIDQGIAVTGSVNQQGEIQPVGGITPKVEGFFAACLAKGLTGQQGVLIPRQNIPNLVLKDEVLRAIEEGQFHIYAIDHVDEGIAILTGVPAGRRLPDGSYEPNTVNHLVDRRLAEMARRLRDFIGGKD